MKVINSNKDGKNKRTLTLRIAESTMSKVDSLAKKNGVSRQKLVEAILEQVITDKGFILDLAKVK